MTPPELQPAVDLALFAWPGGFSPPVPATALPFLAPSLEGTTPLQPAAASLEMRTTPRLELVSAPASLSLPRDLEPRAKRAETRRTPVPAMALETPMERAARERAEDAQQDQRLKDLRAPADAKASGGGGGGFFSQAPFQGLTPQPCESNYDCEQPLVCCDLVFASICCSSGMMVGPPQRSDPVLQRQAIPIPVEVDRGPGDGRVPPPSF